MKREEEVVDREHMFALTRDEGGQYFLEVIVGGFAMDEFVLRLSDEEINRYKAEGTSYLRTLALRIARKASEYEWRRVLD